MSLITTTLTRLRQTGLGASLLLVVTGAFAAPDKIYTFADSEAHKVHLPPLYLATDAGEGLYGVSPTGPASAGGMGLYYSLALPVDGGAIQSEVLATSGVLGLYPGMVATSTGELIFASKPFFMGDNAVYKWDLENAPVNAVSDPADPATTFGDDFQPRGLLAIDGSDNVYLGGGSGALGNGLFRLSADGKLEQLVDFENYLDETSPDVIYQKGQYPAALIVDQQANRLYGINVRTNEADVSGDVSAIPAGDDTAGTLFQIDLNQLQTDGTTPVTVLHTFAKNAEGEIKASDSGQQALVQHGDWLYGTTNKAVWRFKPGEPDSFALVHTFGVEDGDGKTPWGPLVLAEDGAIYGSTRRSVNAGGIDGAGALFKLTPGAAEDRNDDSLAVIHTFNVETDGALPVGLSAGPVADGSQTLYGATARGGNAGDAVAANDADGYGALYALAITLPAELTLNANPTTLTVGESTELTWEVSGADNCVGEDGWAGNKATAGTETLTPDQAGDVTYTLTCTDADDQLVSTQVVVTVQAESSSGGNNAGGGSSGGGGSLPLFLLALLGTALLARQRQG